MHRALASAGDADPGKEGFREDKARWARSSTPSLILRMGGRIEPAEPEPPPAHLEEIWIPWGGLGKDFVIFFLWVFHAFWLFLVVLGMGNRPKSLKKPEKRKITKNVKKMTEND